MDVRVLAIAAGVLLWCGAGSIPAMAHLLNITRVSVSLDEQRALNVQVDVDLALMLGDYAAYARLLQQPVAEQLRRRDELARRTLTEIGLKVDGQAAELKLQEWTLPDTPPDQIGDQTTAAMTMFRYVQSLPAGAKELRLAPGNLAKVEFPLAYTFLIPSRNFTMTRWLELPGVSSRPMRFPEVLPTSAASALATATPTEVTAGSNEQTKTAPEKNAVAETVEKAPPAADVSDLTETEITIARAISTLFQHLRLGFRHIFPDGADHILFVLGLFFLSPRWRPLLSQTTAFTIAHTTTLGLASYGIFSLPARVVEPLIALSIAYIALENIWRPKLGPTRIIVVFLFGLLHGLGFASSLSEVPLPRNQFFTALLAFNFGVDFGQLFVIGVTFLAVGWFRERPWYRNRIVIPCCSVIGAIGLYWTIIRLF